MKEKLNIFFLCFFIAVFVAAAAIWLVFSYRYRQQLSNEEHTYKEIQNKLIRENIPTKFLFTITVMTTQKTHGIRILKPPMV